MVVKQDGSEWHPRTLDAIEAYIDSGGSVQLAKSVRHVVMQKKREGFAVARAFWQDIENRDIAATDHKSTASHET